jgi:hypothetical protein
VLVATTEEKKIKGVVVIEATGIIDTAMTLGLIIDADDSAERETWKVALAPSCSMLASAEDAAAILAGSTGAIDVRGTLFPGSFGIAWTIPITLPPPLAAGCGPLSPTDELFPRLDKPGAWPVVVADAVADDLALVVPSCRS